MHVAHNGNNILFFYAAVATTTSSINSSIAIATESLKIAARRGHFWAGSNYAILHVFANFNALLHTTSDHIKRTNNCKKRARTYVMIMRDRAVFSLTNDDLYLY